MSDRTEEPRRLVIELNAKSNAALARLCEIEELNKTTVTNRAIQVYELIVNAQLAGHTVVVDDGTRPYRLVIL